MNTKKTGGDGLVASVRKTRTAAISAAKSVKKKAVKKTARTSKKASASATNDAKKSNRNSQLVDLFQSGRRVWPD